MHHVRPASHHGAQHDRRSRPACLTSTHNQVRCDQTTLTPCTSPTACVVNTTPPHAPHSPAAPSQAWQGDAAEVLEGAAPSLLRQVQLLLAARTVLQVAVLYELLWGLSAVDTSPTMVSKLYFVVRPIISGAYTFWTVLDGSAMDAGRRPRLHWLVYYSTLLTHALSCAIVLV